MGTLIQSRKLPWILNWLLVHALSPLHSPIHWSLFDTERDFVSVFHIFSLLILPSTFNAPMSVASHHSTTVTVPCHRIVPGRLSGPLLVLPTAARSSFPGVWVWWDVVIFSRPSTHPSAYPRLRYSDIIIGVTVTQTTAEKSKSRESWIFNKLYLIPWTVGWSTFLNFFRIIRILKSSRWMKLDQSI